MQYRVPTTVLTGLAAVTATAIAVTATTSPAGAAVATKRPTFIGSAYGSVATLGSLVHSGATSYVSECTPTVNTARTNKTAALPLPQLGNVGAVTTRVSSTRTGRTVASVTTTKTAATSLLGGLVQAKAITTSARVSLTGATYASASSSTLLGLTVAGRPIKANPSRNQTIALPGLGRVVLNKQTTSVAATQHTAAVTALQLVLNPGTSAMLPAGTVVVGRANAGLHAPTYQRPYGSAYGSTVQVGNTAASGRTAAVYLPCGAGTATSSNTIASTHLAGVLSTGTVTSSANSTDTSKATSAATRSRIASVNLVNGIVKVHAVTTEAHATRTGSHLTLSSRGTSLAGLTIHGKAAVIPARTTSRTIPGLGTLYFNRTSKTSTGISVTALQLVLSQPQGSIAKGTVITVGTATAGVRK